MTDNGDRRRPFGSKPECDRQGHFKRMQRNAQQVTIKPLPPPLGDDEMLLLIDLPQLREGDAKMQEYEKNVAAGHSTTRPKLYRNNVSVHFFNEYGQVLGCLRKDKKSWQTVQGGVEDDDKDESREAPVSFSFPTHGAYDPQLLQAAVREIAEEIGLEDLAAVGCEYVCTIFPPTRPEMEEVLSRKAHVKFQQQSPGSMPPPDVSRLSFATMSQLAQLEKDPSRFFSYEFSGFMGMKARAKGYVGQVQHQLVFFLPSQSISHVNLVPDRAKYGDDVTQEFKAVAWMSPGQFAPLCADFKRSMMGYIFLSEQFDRAVRSFLAGKGGVKELPSLTEGEDAVKLVAPHVTASFENKKRPRSPQ